MAIYKIKSEDKAAFLNRLERLGANISSNDLKNKTELKGSEVVSYFEFNTEDPNLIKKIDSILNQSPAINQISDMENKKKMTKDELKEMVRQELQAVLAEKKKVKGEDKKEKIDENVEGEDDKKIKISLDEYIGDSGAYDLGRWAAEHFPIIWKQFQATSTVTNVDGQQYVDFGNFFTVLATAGTITVSVGMAVVKDQIVDAAKKIKAAAKSLFGGKKMAEGDEGVDPELEKALKELPQDTLAKMAK